MNEAYVSYETAKLLKEKGFDWECRAYWHENNKELIESQSPCYLRNITNPCWFGNTAPTQQMAMRWLIETHNIHIETHFLRASGDYVYNIIHSPLKLDDIHSFPIVFNTREDAIEAALEYVLTNLI